MKNEQKYIWLVRQTQPIDYYDQKTIAVYDNEQDATTLARKLNKEYACGVILTDVATFLNWTMQRTYIITILISNL